MDPVISFFLFLGVCAWLWQNAGRSHAKVMRISRKICQELSYQHLDQTVVLDKVRLGVKHKALVAYRTYTFEYSVRGHDRQRGEVVLCNGTPQWIRLHDSNGAIYFNLDKFGRASGDESHQDE